MSPSSPHVLGAQDAASIGQVRDPAATDTRTLALVLELVESRMTDLSQEWAVLGSAITPRPGVLHTDSILALVRSFAGSRGKMLRPRMAHWGWVAAGGLEHGRGYPDLVRLGAALELLHCFALVHDDVMDASELRRGRLSVHAVARAEHLELGGRGDPQRYAESIAILVGDLLHSEADLLVADLPAPLRAGWRTMAIELMMGQGRDLVGAANGRRDLPHAQEVARAKSGAYTVWRPLQLGALAAGGGDDLLAVLQEYGHHAGLAFALRDDILGVLGDPDQTGKPVGDDLVAGKPTVLLALAERRFSPAWRLVLRRMGSERVTASEVARLCAELVRAGVVEQVEELITASVEAAERALSSSLMDSRAADGLRRLVHQMAWRES